MYEYLNLWFRAILLRFCWGGAQRAALREWAPPIARRSRAELCAGGGGVSFAATVFFENLAMRL